MSSAFFVAVLLVTLDSLASGKGDPSCWDGAFTFDLCCDLQHGPQGNALCWDAVHTYHRCCETPGEAQGVAQPSSTPPPMAKPTEQTSSKQEPRDQSVWELLEVDGASIPLEYVLAGGIVIVSVIFLLCSAKQKTCKEEVPERLVITGAIGEHGKKIDGLYVLESERFGDQPMWRSEKARDIWLLRFPGSTWWSIVSTEVKTQFEKGDYARSQDGYEIPPSALFARSQNGCELPTSATNWSMWDNIKFEASTLSVLAKSDQKKEDGAENPMEDSRWTCPRCDEINKASRLECNNCGKRAAAEDQATQDVSMPSQCQCSHPMQNGECCSQARPAKKRKVSKAAMIRELRVRDVAVSGNFAQFLPVTAEDFDLHGMSFTPLQEVLIPLAMSGHNIVGIGCGSGNGKTWAYLWPAIKHIQAQDTQEAHPICLVVAHDTARVEYITKQASKMLVKVGAQRSHIVAAMPGRLLELMNSGDVSLERVSYVVLDDADLLLEESLDQVNAICSALRPHSQLLLFCEFEGASQVEAWCDASCGFVTVALGRHRARCKKMSEAAKRRHAKEDTVREALLADSGFSVLVEALRRTRLLDDLEEDGPFTVFAPPDTAFHALLNTLGVNKEELLARIDLADILRYHVIAGKVASSSLSDTQDFTTGDGKTLTVTRSGDVIMAGSATVSGVDAECSNGVIHVIDAVLLPPVPPNPPNPPNPMKVTRHDTMAAVAGLLSALVLVAATRS